jgi:chromosome segregation ATPase
MFWWVLTVVCICGALLIQYMCSSKILRMKQAISIKNMALRDVRSESQRLDEQTVELKNQHQSLTRSISRLRRDIKELVPQMQEAELEVPEPNFPLEELEEDQEGDPTLEA